MHPETRVKARVSHLPSAATDLRVSCAGAEESKEGESIAKEEKRNVDQQNRDNLGEKPSSTPKKRDEESKASEAELWKPPKPKVMSPKLGSQARKDRKRQAIKNASASSSPL
ncbi:hypothetical protein F2Q68_00010758 [Brassica cretica]|uniref:Uncharacterized protein n=1 Tax=Brassica cretica TaxID=69181 RepID=A0A8S9KVN3_BRACR|nr:hypothetical protein F2Q68_00010758 [Brassica cretica]